MTDNNDDDPFAELDRIEARIWKSTDPPRHFNRQGQPITLGQWARLWEDKSYQVLVQTWTRSGAWVSTVWLGNDHSFSLTGPPIIFETMVFHDGDDIMQDRYATELAATAGHWATVEQFGGEDPNPPAQTPLEARRRAIDARPAEDDDGEE